MATKASKSSKSSNNAVPASAIKACHIAIIGTLRKRAAETAVYNAAVEQYKKGKESRARIMVAALDALWTTLGSADAWASAVVSLFGNGETAKAKRIAGSIRDELGADAEKMGSELTRIRTVAIHYGRADVRETAKKSGLRAAADLAKPKAKRTAVAAAVAEAKAAPVTTLADLIADILKASGNAGLVQVAQVMKSACLSQKDTIRANLCAEFATRLAA